MTASIDIFREKGNSAHRNLVTTLFRTVSLVGGHTNIIDTLQFEMQHYFSCVRPTLSQSKPNCDNASGVLPPCSQIVAALEARGNAIHIVTIQIRIFDVGRWACRYHPHTSQPNCDSAVGVSEHCSHISQLSCNDAFGVTAPTPCELQTIRQTWEHHNNIAVDA